MKFKIVRSKFLDGLKRVQNIVAGKGSLPILQNVLLEADGSELKMTTTDLDISVRCIIQCEVLEKGETTLPVKFLFNSISKVEEGEVSVEVDFNERAVIRAGSAKYTLVGMPAKDFPRLPVDEGSFSYNIEQSTLREMLRKVAYAASQDDTRRTLKGVLMSFKDEKLTLVATDGRRLAMVESELEFPKDGDKDIVLPSKAVGELQRSLAGEGEVKVTVNKSQVAFDLGSLNLYSKLVDETYPNYRQVIPHDTAEHISVDRQLLLSAPDRASVMTIDEAHSTKLIFESGRLIVTSAATEIGEAKDEVPIKYAGDKIEIMFNPTYLMDPLKAIDDDIVTINLNNGHSPAVVKCQVPFLYVLMPLRAN